MNLAIVGATGLVGSTFLKVLEERDLGIDNLYLFASARSAGKKINFRGKEYIVEELTESSFDRDTDIALFFSRRRYQQKICSYCSFKRCACNR